MAKEMAYRSMLNCSSFIRLNQHLKLSNCRSHNTTFSHVSCRLLDREHHSVQECLEHLERITVSTMVRWECLLDNSWCWLEKLSLGLMHWINQLWQTGKSRVYWGLLLPSRVGFYLTWSKMFTADTEKSKAAHHNHVKLSGSYYRPSSQP